MSTLTSNERLLELVGELDHYAETEGYERGYPGGLSPGQRKRARAELEAGIRALTAHETGEQSRATADVVAERRRQVDYEGWDAEHDDQYQNSGQMAQAAAAYALRASPAQYNHAHDLWPWSDEWWKPKDVRRDLVRAAALIIAEIERLDRSSQKASEPHAWHFNRYRNGRLMAEGVTVHTATEAEAWEKAESLKRQFQLPTDELRLSQSEGEDRG